MDAITCFKFVRDIPYRIPTAIDEADYCCLGKHKILHVLLSSLGLQVRFRACAFLWSSLDLPEEVKRIPHKDVCIHRYVEVFNREQNKWIIVDATWDKGLSSKFKINEWDGKSDTELAVKPVKIYDENRSKEFIEIDTKLIIEDLKANGEFYKAVNKWLESIREVIK
jgi:hypothetical protein